jgi:hypothetical protein
LKLLIALAFTATLSAQGPFGFHAGMRKSDVLDLVGKGAVLEQDNDTLTVDKAPSGHRAVEFYYLAFCPKRGLVKVSAVSKNVKTSRYGSDLQDAFLDVEKTLNEIYGTGKRYDFLMDGSLWDEPRDWMTALGKKERTLITFWSARNGHTNLPNKITSVTLEAMFLKTEVGYWEVRYEFVGFTDWFAERREKETKVF